MSEIQTTQQAPQESENAASLIEKATKAADRIEAETKKAEVMLERYREVEARRILGGKSEGKPQEVPPKEETPKEYKDRIMRGR